MSTLKVNNIRDVAGEGQPDIIGVAKAFVNFNGTGAVAVRQAFNVDAVVDNGTGDYTIVFIEPMPSGSYSVSGILSGDGVSSGSVGVRENASNLPNSCRLAVWQYSGQAADRSVVSFTFFSI